MFSNGDNNQPVLCWLTFLFNPGVVMGVAKAYVIISIFRVNNLVSTKCMAANSRGRATIVAVRERLRIAEGHLSGQVGWHNINA